VKEGIVYEDASGQQWTREGNRAYSAAYSPTVGWHATAYYLTLSEFGDRSLHEIGELRGCWT
jgi:hypothetical protein